jgi:hypothetical protein
MTQPQPKRRHLAAKPPYMSTEIHYTRTKIEIDEMLLEFGAKAKRWTDTPESIATKEMPILEFIVPVTIKGKAMEMGIKLEKFPILSVIVGSKYNKSRKVLVNASYRLLYWYLQQRLLGVKWGIEDVFQTFTSRVMNQLPDGTVVTLGEAIVEHPEIFQEILPTFEIKLKALPKKEKDVQQEIIDTEISQP